jgi:hypothetical protein
VKRFEYLESRLDRKPQTEEETVEMEADIEQYRKFDVPSLVKEFADTKEWVTNCYELSVLYNNRIH